MKMDDLHKCSFPGCPDHGAVLGAPATMAVNGRLIAIPRLCCRHRLMVGHPSAALAVAEQNALRVRPGGAAFSPSVVVVART